MMSKKMGKYLIKVTLHTLRSKRNVFPPHNLFKILVFLLPKEA